MEELQEDISTVIAKNYSPDSITEFFQKYTFVSMFEPLYHEGNNLKEPFIKSFVNFMATIFRQEKYADMFLFESSTAQKQLLGYIMQHKSVEIRQLIPLALRGHTSKITSLLDQCDDNTFDEYLRTIFMQLDDESSEVGLKALDIIVKIAKESRHYNYSVVKRPIFVDYLERGLRNQNSVVMMRYFDLLIEITNASEDVFQFFKGKGLMDLMIDTYKTDDILVKLSIVESIPKMGDSAWNSKFINETLVQKSMIQECFDENADFYVRKNLAVLIAKLVSRGLLPLNQNMKTSFAQMCKSWLMSGFKEELYGVLDVIGHLVLRQGGVEILFSNEDLLKVFYSLSLKTDQTIKTKFLFAYSQVFSEEMEKKLSAYMKKAFSLMGSIEEVLQNKRSIQDIPTNSFDKSFKWLLKLVHVPFVDIELHALAVLRNVLRFDWSIMDFAKQENSLSYFTEHVAKSPEVFELKRHIIRELIENIDETKTKDIFLLDFKNKLIAGKQSLKGPKDMSVETEVL